MNIYILSTYNVSKLKYSFPKLRYRANAKKCRPLLHSTEPLERDNIEIFGLQVNDERNY